MKRSALLTVLFAFSATLFFTAGSSAVADDGVTVWTVDESRSSIRFVSDAPAERIVGTSEEISGTVRWNETRPSTTSGKLSFPVDSMRTGNSLRDRHLTEEDWLHAEENPDVTFNLEKLEDVRRARSENRVDYRATAVGTVELNGVKKPNKASVEIAVLPERNLARIQPTIQFRLADHNVKGADGVVGSEVGKTIDVDGLIYATWE